MKDYVVFDFEVSELLSNDTDAEIIYINAFKYKNSKLVDKFEGYSKPSKKLSEFAKEVIELDINKINNGISEEELVKKFIDFIDDYVVVSFRTNFFMEYFNNCIFKNNIDCKNIKYINYVEWAKKYFDSCKVKLIPQNILEFCNVDIPNNNLDKIQLVIKILNDKYRKDKEICTNIIPIKNFYGSNTTEVNGFKVEENNVISLVSLYFKNNSKLIYEINKLYINDKSISFDELYNLDNLIELSAHIASLKKRDNFKIKIKYVYICSNVELEKRSQDLIDEYITGINYAYENSIPIKIIGDFDCFACNFNFLGDEVIKKLVECIDEKYVRKLYSHLTK